ncbi:site-specific integrase [Paenibacillus sp. ISL-20]|uniref:phage lytic cycle repressor MrpR family protein n=1 Tax=Paenibacillus sp. ISL-20 TaxID=2819163 RepID=UPI001BE84172|nr:site-specific integrase [Paenibacillus sp. ISL-20]MBT2759907.1 hypothetical protein [Paenibacillus sp. ISL-20]
MSNQIYEQGLYNEDQKEMFLNKLNKNTRAAYERVLNRAKTLEEQFEKDLYDFNIYEVERLIHYLNPGTLSSVTASASIIQTYIRWGIEQDLRANNLNPLDAIIGDDFYAKFIDKTNKTIFSKEEIEDITGGLVNFQDSAIVQCIFEGVVGKRYSEILNLTRSDIDESTGIVTLKNEIDESKVEERKIKLSDDLIKMLIKAAEERIYHKNNGHPSENIKAPTADLADSEFVFRNAMLNTKESGRADYHLIFRRLKKIAEWNQQPYLTGINIRNSGMLYMASKFYYKNYCELGKTEIDAVCAHFNIPKLKNKQDYHTTRLRKEFLNVSKIEELYPIEE